MFSEKLKRNGNYFRKSFTDRVFHGVNGAININTLERLYEYDNLVIHLNDIFSEDKWEDYIKQIYSMLSIFYELINKNHNDSWRLVPVHKQYNTLSICKLGLMVIGNEALVSSNNRIMSSGYLGYINLQ